MAQVSGGIYIDDAGTPGVLSPSAFLHSDRKSWAAVIVPDSAASQVATALDIFLAGIGGDFRARKLHFTDIYPGRSVFEGVAIERRYKLIDLMATIFERFQLPILFQTCSPQFMSEIRQKFEFGSNIGFLDLKKHDHFSLLYLLFQVRGFMAEHRQHFRRPLPSSLMRGWPGGYRMTCRLGRIQCREAGSSFGGRTSLDFCNWPTSPPSQLHGLSGWLQREISRTATSGSCVSSQRSGCASVIFPWSRRRLKTSAPQSTTKSCGAIEDRKACRMTHPCHHGGIDFRAECP